MTEPRTSFPGEMAGKCFPFRYSQTTFLSYIILARVLPWILNPNFDLKLRKGPGAGSKAMICLF